MDTLVSQLHHQDQPRPGSSSSSVSVSDRLVYPPPPHSPFVPQQRFQPPSHYQHPSRTQSPPSSSLQISTINSTVPEVDADEQTAHPSRMQPQFPLPCQPQQQQHSLYHSYPHLSRPLNHREQDLLSHLERLKYFLATAPSRWNSGESDVSDPTIPVGHPNSTHPALNRFLLPNSEYVSCVLWNGLYHITGTDIVRALVFRFDAFGRPVKNMKKFEEGVFSDLRNLKPGHDACLEEPKSPFLDLLFKYQCIRTQKKQKVFYWFSVPHDRLFLDALERDLKREKMGLEPTTLITGEPANSFTYDPKKSLYEQFCKSQSEGEGDQEAAGRRTDESAGESEDDKNSDNAHSADEGVGKKKIPTSLLNNPNAPFASMFSLFEGSPTYKQRRKKTTKKGSSDGTGRSGSIDEGGEPYIAGPPIRDANRMTAADLFRAQAREPRATSIQVDHQQAQSQFGRGRLESRNTFPIAPHVYSATGNNHRSQSLSHATTVSGEWPYGNMVQNTATEATSMAQPTKSKAFSCPLLTCSRMFRTIETLRKHLKTHKMNGVPRFVPGVVNGNSLDDGINADVEGDDGFSDLHQYEVEVQGQIHDVTGGEEGLVTTSPIGFVSNGMGRGPAGSVGQRDAYYPGSNNSSLHYPPSSSPEPASYRADPSSSIPWVARSASSPAFSTSPVPSPPARMSSVGPVAGYTAMGEYVTSMSAPSHKVSFDHGTIYPGHLQGTSTGPGPVRRHRSVTPSVARYGESIRRPYSAAMSDLPAGNSRSYHPYAVSSGSHSSSAQSSPRSYNMPLDYGSGFSGQMSVNLPRSVPGSRPGSSHLQDQMSDMLHLDSMETESMGYTSESNGNGYGGIYRTDSPASFANSNGPYAATVDGSSGHNTAVDSPSLYGLHYGSQSSVDHPSFYEPGHSQSVPM